MGSIRPDTASVRRLRLLLSTVVLGEAGAVVAVLAVVESGERLPAGIATGLAVVVYHGVVALSFAGRNRAPDERTPRTSPGMANLITLARTTLVGILAGVAVLMPATARETGIAAVLYAVFLLADLADGYVARRRRECTELGRILENEADSLGVLAASLLLVTAGTLPWYYLAIGLARPAFALARAIRRLMDRPEYPLRHSPSGRILAALQMNALLAGMLPFVPIGAVRVVMPLVTVPFLLGFLRDFYGVSTGRWPLAGGRRRSETDG